MGEEVSVWHLKRYFLKLSLIRLVFSQDICFPPAMGTFWSLLKIKTQFIYSEIHPFLCILLWVLMNIHSCVTSVTIKTQHSPIKPANTLCQEAQPWQTLVCYLSFDFFLCMHVTWKGSHLMQSFKSGFFHLGNASDIHPFVSCISSKFLLKAE